jgi:glutamate dehydrogenase (NAD(P)+)
VQGFGNVAQHAIRLYQQLGGTVTAVSCWNQADNTSYTFRKEDGIDLDQLLHIANRFGEIDKEKARDSGYEVLNGEAWLKQEVDVLLPCALERQITDENVDSISPRVKVVAEGANGPTTPAAGSQLDQKGILVIPDFLANAGGVTCSYFEQVQSNMNFYWEKDEVLGRLDLKMTSAFIAVSNLAREQHISMREAAYVIAVDRVARACRDRGWL